MLNNIAGVQKCVKELYSDINSLNNNISKFESMFDLKRKRLYTFDSKSYNKGKEDVKISDIISKFKINRETK
ncbi:hypothetical protein [Anaerofustis sp.]|jgi:hypothetical protein|uniref:hypothetical protein n=1 Tax=Anaerofustis sp. TaxID=1872517 RepID=UPI0025C3D405|nr:hypothetical protein [Anaerofustis sp.]